VFNESLKTTTGVSSRAFLSSGRDRVCVCEIGGLHFLYDFIKEKNVSSVMCTFKFIIHVLREHILLWIRRSLVDTRNCYHTFM